MAKSYFRSSGFMTDPVIKTGSWTAIDLGTLPSFLRTLLVMDGTVTKSLEAWFWEPVNIIARHNQIEALSSTVPELEANIGDQVLHREVSLYAQKTKRIFATAQSIVSLQHLPKDIGALLIEGKIGIGELLRDKELETYRDIFDINYYPDFLKSPVVERQHLNELKGEVISRSYRIWVNGNPAIIVNEFFPIELYRESG